MFYLVYPQTTLQPAEEARPPVLGRAR